MSFLEGSNPSLSARFALLLELRWARPWLPVVRSGNAWRMSETWPPAEDFEAVEEDGAPEDDEESLLDRMRGTGVGVEDPNIVGDAGPTDVPPGRDPGSDGLFADPPPPE